MSFYSFIDKNFTARPHRFVPWAVFVGILLYYLTNFHSPFYTLLPSDPDDYMRLDETINWLQGQGWYDLSQPRLSPGMHTVVHWSRLLDVPIALLMLPFLKCGMQSAAIIAALIEPLLLLLLLFALASSMARPFVGRGRARLVTLFVPFIGSLLFNFSPLRVDHHNWEILIAGVGLMAVPCMLFCRGGWKMAIFAAMSYAIGLWISPEIMPALILMLGLFALLGAWRGGYVLRNAAVFGAALAVSTAAVLPAALPISQWHDLTISWFSTGYVIFAALTGAAFVFAWLLGRHTGNRFLRVALMAALSGFAALLFLYIVPGALHGPFADYDDFDASTALDYISEAKPFLESLKIDPYNHRTWLVTFFNFLHHLLPEVMSLGFCIYACATGRSRRRQMWAVYGICLGATMALGVFVQYRVLWFAYIFQLPPMAYLVWRYWDRFESRWTRWQLTRAALVMFLVLTQVPAFAHRLIHEEDGHDSCRLRPAAEYLAGLRDADGHTFTILAGADEGPELLFRTPHSVLAGNYDVPANKDVFDFFTARDDAAAMAILRKRHAEKVLTCHSLPPFYAGTGHPKIGKNAFPKIEADGKLHLVSSLDHPTLAEKLVNGPVPDWLKPVEIPGGSDYLLFDVRYPATPNPMTAK